MSGPYDQRISGCDGRDLALGKPNACLWCPRDVATRLTSDDIRTFFDGPYRDILAAVALVTGSRPAAEDAVHEALARAWERGDGIDHLDRWVVTVALNLARSRWRKLRREVHSDDKDFRRGNDGTTHGVPPMDPVLVDLKRALRALPTRQREVAVLHYLLDMPIGEVAELLGLSPGGVKHALFRARRSLAETLGIDTEDQQGSVDNGKEIVL